MTAPTLMPPKVTAPMIELTTMIPTAVVVQDATGAVYALDRLTAAQADDPDLTVLVDHPAALDLVACAGGRLPAAAKLATTVLAAQHARGLL